MTEEEQARERIAEQEHRQWCTWALTLMDKETLSQERIDRWEILAYKPYSDLTEAEKDQDRYWADRILSLLKELGYRKVPELRVLSDEEIYQTALNRTMLNSYESLSALEFSYTHAVAQTQLESIQRQIEEAEK